MSTRDDMKSFCITILIILLVIMSASEGTIKSSSTPESSSTTTGWSHLVGIKGTEAQEYILKEHPQKKVVIVKHNNPVTMDFSTERIRVFVDDSGNVVRTPTVG